jgi:hypothetical protein
VLLGVVPCPKGESDGMCSEKGEGCVKCAWKTLPGTAGSDMAGKLGNFRAALMGADGVGVVVEDDAVAVEASIPERCEAE